jgi:hypothetical protein
MSELKENEVIYCQNCDTTLKEITFCKSRRKRNGDLTRCMSVICRDCKYCNYCHQRIHELKYNLRRRRYGKDDELTNDCKQYLYELQNMHGIKL